MFFDSTSGDCARLYVKDTLMERREACSDLRVSHGRTRAAAQEACVCRHVGARARTVRPWLRCSQSSWGGPTSRPHTEQ
jgi:hypothetical protein